MDMSRGTAVKLFGGWSSLSYHPDGQNHENTKNQKSSKKKKSEKNLVENDESS